MSTRRRVTNAEVGVAIVMALLALSLLAVVGLGLATMGSGNLRNVVMLNQGNQASFAAEGAAWLRAARYGDNPTDLSTLNGSTPALNVVYSAEVIEGPATASNGFQVPSGTVYFLATATTPGYNNTTRQAAILARAGANAFWDMAAFAGSQIELTGGSGTYSYDSTIDLNPPVPPWNGTAHPGDATAHIGTNGTSGSIILDGTSRVGGAAAEAKVFGPVGSTEGSVVSGGSSPTNYVAYNQQSSNRSLPDWVDLGAPPVGATTVSGGTIAPGNYGDVQLTPGTLLLDAQNSTGPVAFSFNQLQMQTGAIIQVINNTNEVEVKIYCHDQIQMSGGSIINPLKKPSTLQFYAQNQVQIQDDGTSAFYVFYSPSQVQVQGGSKLYGSVVTKANLQIQGGSEIWFDEALLTNGTGGPGGFTILSVQKY